MSFRPFLALPLLCAAVLSSAAYADTLYTSAAAFAAATAGPTTTDFGTGSGGNFSNAASAGNPYSVGAITITVDTSNTFVNLDNGDYYNVNSADPTYPNGNFLIVFGNSPTDSVTIDFPSSTAFGIDLGGTFDPGESFTFALSDGTTGSYVASSFATSGNPLDFLGITTTAPIDSITLSSADGSDVATYDNVVFASAVSPIPEPSSLVLLGTGLLGALAAARRRFMA